MEILVDKRNGRIARLLHHSCFLLALGLPAPGLSATITVESKTIRVESMSAPIVIRIVGAISKQDVVTFRKLFSQLPPPPDLTGVSFRTVQLAGPGGDMDAAMEIGRMIRAAQFSTIVVPTEEYNVCASSCVLMFVAGVGRLKRWDSLLPAQSSRLGIHRPFDTQVGTKPQEQADKQFKAMAAKVRAYLAEMNITERLADEMIRIPSDDAHYLRVQEAEEYGLFGEDPAYADMKASASAKKLGISKVEYYERLGRARRECSELSVLSDEHFQCWQRIFYPTKGTFIPIDK